MIGDCGELGIFLGAFTMFVFVTGILCGVWMSSWKRSPSEILLPDVDPGLDYSKGAPPIRHVPGCAQRNCECPREFKMEKR